MSARAPAWGLALALAAVLVACGEAGETVAPSPPPEELVSSFLGAAEGGAADRGWSLLHPATQSDMFGNDQAAYIAMASRGAWGSFEWRVSEVVADDPALYYVYLQLAGTDVPPLLTDTRNNLFLVGPLDARNPVHLDVRYDDSGPGIWAKGG